MLPLTARSAHGQTTYNAGGDPAHALLSNTSAVEVGGGVLFSLAAHVAALSTRRPFAGGRSERANGEADHEGRRECRLRFHTDREEEGVIAITLWRPRG
jgi:hypothetical protein